jgi:undecaprenyl pyrophosphate phosphatase UppP
MQPLQHSILRLFLLAYVRTNTFIPFGIYRILLALTFALIFL